MPLLLAAATNHTLAVCLVAAALAFVLGVYGHMSRSRTMVITAIVAIAAITLYFVVTGEAETFN